MRRTAIVPGVVLLLAGCGSAPAPAEQAARQIEQGAGQVQRAAGTIAAGAQRGAAEAAAGLKQMAQGVKLSAQAAVAPVPFESLTALVPDLPGWTRSEPRGENVSTPVAYARVETRYRQDESRLRLEITDTALSQILLAPVGMFLGAGYHERSTDGFKRAEPIGGHPGAIDWNTRSRRGEVIVLVAHRFLVKAVGDDVPGIEVVRQAAQAVDFGALASLK